MSTALTLPEKTKLQRCEATIQKGIDDWQETGFALLTIRDDQLYRESHDSFEDYLDDRWDMKRRRAYQLISAATVAASLEEQDALAPQNERQARELSKVGANLRPAVMAEATKQSGGNPTVGAIRDAAAKLTPSKRRGPKPGKEATRPQDRKAALNKLGILIRALDKLGISESLSEPLEQIMEAIKATT